MNRWNWEEFKGSLGESNSQRWIPHILEDLYGDTLKIDGETWTWSFPIRSSMEVLWERILEREIFEIGKGRKLLGYIIGLGKLVEGKRSGIPL